MCLAVPMRIETVSGPDSALVELDGERQTVNVSLVDAPAPGDYVIVKAVYAIEKLEVAEAVARIAMFDALAAPVP